MKIIKFLFIFLLGIISFSGYSQTIIASDGFNNSSIFTIVGGGYYSGNSASGDRPASSSFTSEGTYAYGISNGTSTLTSPTINASGYTGIQMTLRLASFSINSTANGADAADEIKIEISPDNGVTWYPTLKINGNSNAYWSYLATGNATTSYDGDMSPVIFSPAGGGSRTTDGYDSLTITGIPASGILKIRLTLLNNSSNERWVIDDFKLIGTPGLSVGFTSSSGSVVENSGNYSIGVTVNTAPSSNIVMRITDAGIGTASNTTDFTFTTTDLTFLTSSTYPQTQYANVTILNDIIPEANKYRNFSLTQISGPTVTPSPSNHQMTIIDDDVLEGVVLNEFSQGTSSKEYIELVVIGIPGTTVDLRGWIIDDNSGIFSGGYGTQLGIAPGHVKFSNECSWEKVPVGSIILLYNSTDKNASITIPDDPTDGNLDYVYVVGIESAPSSCSTMPTTNLYFSSDCTIPNNSSYDTYTPPSYTNVDWNAMQFRNDGDALQIRSSNGGFFHGLSYGNKGSRSDCSSCQLNQTNHPDYSVYGTNSLYFTGSSNITYANLNLTDNDFRKLNNWSVTTTSSPNSLETPGTFNDNSLNKNWILSLRTPFDVVIDDQSYTCDLRGFESRYYLDNNDKIIFYIKNNTSTNHGSFTAQTIIHNTASIGKGFQNLNLYGLPVFMQKTFVATPTTSTPANYKIKFYVTTQELQDYCNYINPLLQSVFGNPHSYTPSNVISHLKIYRTSTTDRAWTVTSDPQVQIVVPVVGTYGAYTTFEYDGFTNFSGYALGDIITPVVGLPIEINEFKSSCDNDITKIHFSTLSQSNVDYFILQKSEDGRNWSDVKKIKGEIFSNQLKEYNFTDEAGYSYYRIKEVDLDGKIIYSRIILSNCSGGKSTLIRQIDNTIIISSNENITTDVYAIDGKLILQSNSSELNLDNISKGIYIIKCYSDDMRINITKKIIIQ